MSELTSSLRWQLPELSDAEVAVLRQELGLSELAARLLLHRGFTTVEAAREFLSPSPARLHQPASLPDIKITTERVLDALKKGERVCIYGDYDVDGITSTALLFSTLRQLGADVIWYLPHRESEGYGLSPAGIDFCQKQGVRLLITTDCGSTDHIEAQLAAQTGIDLIITDHHEVPPVYPPALAFVNPKRPDSTYPFAELAGVGVAFKVAWSLLSALGRPREELTILLDLVGIGTIADMVPLTGENRILARLGLSALRQTSRVGLRALLKRAGIAGRRLTSHDVSFVLAPRLNAAGRISHAGIALELLLSEDQARAERLAEILHVHNQKRQNLGEQTLAQAIERIEQDKLHEQLVIVVAADGWHQGVIGIVASKLVERYYRPSFVIALQGNQGKGSGRSINGFNLYESLQASAEHLSGFGGHKYAAGINLPRQNIPAFAEAINRYAASLPAEVYQPSIKIDALCRLEEIDEELLKFLAQLEPYGPENRKPVLAALGLEVVGYPRRVGKNHLRLTLRSNQKILPALAWGRSDFLPSIASDRPGCLDVCFSVEQNTYQGRGSIHLTLHDLRTSENSL